MKHFTFLLLALWLAVFSGSARAQDFERFFDNRTLRVDYTFAGNAREQHIHVSELLQFPGWSGRRHHLNELPLAGNGDITMRDKATSTARRSPPCSRSGRDRRRLPARTRRSRTPSCSPTRRRRLK